MCVYVGWFSCSQRHRCVGHDWGRPDQLQEPVRRGKGAIGSHTHLYLGLLSYEGEKSEVHDQKWHSLDQDGEMA